MLSKAKCILDVHTQVTDRALNLRVAQQQLDGAQVARRLVDYDAFVRLSECVP
jgi:hypothetical protein